MRTFVTSAASPYKRIVPFKCYVVTQQSCSGLSSTVSYSGFARIYAVQHRCCEGAFDPGQCFGRQMRTRHLHQIFSPSRRLCVASFVVVVSCGVRASKLSTDGNP
jgi:hypothetical protein